MNTDQHGLEDADRGGCDMAPELIQVSRIIDCPQCREPEISLIEITAGPPPGNDCPYLP